MAKNKISDPEIYIEVWIQGIRKLKRIEMSLIYHHFPSDQNLREPIFESQTKLRFIKGMFWTPSFLVYIYGPFLISGLRAIQNRSFSPSINGGHFQGTECFLSTTVVALKFNPISNMYPTLIICLETLAPELTSTCSETHNVHFLGVVVEGNEAIMALPPTFH